MGGEDEPGGRHSATVGAMSIRDVPHFTTLLVEAVILMAGRQCRERECDAEAKLPGSRSRPLRCRDCPLDDVDRLIDFGDADA